MRMTSSKGCLKKFLFLAATGLLGAGVSVDVVAQHRGGGRAPGVVGSVRPVGSAATLPGREIIGMTPRRRGAIDDSPLPSRRDTRVLDVERTRREAAERTERERREQERRDDENRRRAGDRREEDEANRFQKLGRWLSVSPERLQNFYLQAKAADPDLRLSQFFAAFVIADRLSGSNPSVTPQAILRGLDSGMSMERTLLALGLNGEEASAAIKWAERIVKHLKP